MLNVLQTIYTGFKIIILYLLLHGDLYFLNYPIEEEWEVAGQLYVAYLVSYYHF